MSFIFAEIWRKATTVSSAAAAVAAVAVGKRFIEMEFVWIGRERE